MAATIAQRIRLLLDAQKWNQPSNLVDQLTGVAPIIASGADLQFEFEIQDGAPTLLDYGNVASVVVELTANSSPRNNNIIFSQALAVANITTAYTLANFLSGAGQACLILVPNASSQIALTSSSSNYVLAVYAVSTDATAKNRPILLLNIQVVDAGLPTPNPVLPQPFKVGTKLSFVCGDGLTRDLTIGAGPIGGQWVSQINQVGYNGPGQALFSLYCADGSWRDLSLQLQDGFYVLAINQNGHS